MDASSLYDALVRMYPDATVAQETDVVLAQRTVYTFTTENDLGLAKYFVMDVPFNDDEFLEIYYVIRSSSGNVESYEQTVRLMLLSMFKT